MKNSSHGYVRDKRSPVPKNEMVSRAMRANKHKNSNPELLLRQKLREKGFIGYRLHCNYLSGSPDIAFTAKRIAIFVHGCFWHRCPFCNYDLPKNNRDFWEKKFITNVKRDRKKARNLRNLGWKVLTVWECQLKSNPQKIIKRIERKFHEKNKSS